MVSSRVPWKRVRIKAGSNTIFRPRHVWTEMFQTSVSWSLICALLISFVRDNGALKAVVVVACILGFSEGVWRSLTIGAVLGHSSLRIQNYWRTFLVDRDALTRVGQGSLRMGLTPQRVLVVEHDGKVLRIQASPTPDDAFRDAFESLKRYVGER